MCSKTKIPLRSNLDHSAAALGPLNTEVYVTLHRSKPDHHEFYVKVANVRVTFPENLLALCKLKQTYTGNMKCASSKLPELDYRAESAGNRQLSLMKCSTKYNKLLLEKRGGSPHQVTWPLSLSHNPGLNYSAHI